MGTTHADNAYYDGSEVTGPGASVSNASGIDALRHWDSPQLRGLMWHQAHLVDPPSADQQLGFSPHAAVYEMRPESTAAIRPGEASRYFYSGFFGGRRQEMYAMLQAIARNRCFSFIGIQSLSLCVFCASLTYWHAHSGLRRLAAWHARTHARTGTHACTHARTHARTPESVC